MNLRVFYYTNRHGYNHIKDIAVTKMQMLTKMGNVVIVYVNLTKLKLSGMESQWKTGCIRLACGYLWGTALITLIKVDRPTKVCCTIPYFLKQRFSSVYE